MNLTLADCGDVVCWGVHILDVLGRPVEVIPPGQHSVLIDEIRLTAAGTAAGTSVDLAKLGVRVRNVGALGDDYIGDVVADLLSSQGVDVTHVIRRRGERTSATILPIRPNGERPALHAAGASATATFGDFSPETWTMVESARVVHLGGLDAMPALDSEGVAAVVARARERGAVVTMDVLRNEGPEGLERMAPILRYVNWFCPNDEQLRTLTGRDDLEEAAHVVRQRGVDGVVVTRGAQGCLVVEAERTTGFPALAVDVVDTTGCGDAFDAGFVAGLVAGLEPLEAAWLATACGALVATGLGSDAGIVDLAQVVARLASWDDCPDAVGVAGALREFVNQ